MMYISNPLLKPDIKSMVENLYNPTSGFVFDYGKIIKFYLKISYEISNWSEDENKLMEMITCLNGKYKYPLWYRTSSLINWRPEPEFLWFRTIPENLDWKKGKVQYHILSSRSMSHFLTPAIEDYVVEDGPIFSYFSNIYFKMDKKILTTEVGQKLDYVNFGTHTVTFVTPELKERILRSYGPIKKNVKIT